MEVVERWKIYAILIGAILSATAYAQDDFQTAKYHIKLFNTKKSWNEAQSTCKRNHGTLVQLDDVEVRNKVYEIIQRTDWFSWIGAKRRNHGSKNWEWLDGSVVKMNLIQWEQGQPDNHNENEDRLVITKKKQFMDVAVDFSAAVICQAEKNYCEMNTKACKNGGTCSSSDADDFTCACAQGYYGETCANEYCDVNPSPCANGGSCSSIQTGRFFLCNCSDGYYGDTCQDKYCFSHPNTCKNDGTCSSTHSPPFYTCNCEDTGYYGNKCEDTYCEHHENPCKNNGECTSTTQHKPYYECKCAQTGYGGLTCDRELIQLNSTTKAIGIVGEYASIDIQIKTYDGLLTIVAYKGKHAIDGIQNKTSIGNGTTTFKLPITQISDKGNYMFVAYAESKAYSRNTTVRVEVHENATITNISHEFIFSPVTNGSSEVTCNAIGIPQPKVSWKDAKNKTVNNGSVANGVYQTKDANRAILHVENALLTDDGGYTCIAKNTVGEQKVAKVSENHTRLAVYGNPTITSIHANPCSERGVLTVNWKPNIQTTSVLHRFVTKSINASKSHTFTIYQKTLEESSVVFNNLEPYTEYETTIEVCPDQCLAKLRDSSLQTTGYGLPKAARNTTVQKNAADSRCIVKWIQPNTPDDQITGYEVLVVETWIYKPPDSSLKFTKQYLQNIDAHTMSYALDTQHNRNYDFNVTAKTCAGSGETVTASGICATNRKAPSVVPVALLPDTPGVSSTIKLTVLLPDETNGPVSCSFVIVHRGNNTKFADSFGMKDLRKASDAAFSGAVDINYLAVAIKRKDMTGGKYNTFLGNGNLTTCDVSKVFTGTERTKRNTETQDLKFEGNNIPLNTGRTVYGFFIVTTIPAENGEILFQSSKVQSFINGQVEQLSLIWIVGVVGGVLLVVLIGAFAYIWIRKRKPKKEGDIAQIELPDVNGTVNPAIETEPEIESPYVNVGVETTITNTDIPFTMLQRQYVVLDANNSMKFREQFQEIKEKSKQFGLLTTVGGSEAMLKKNRYKNILAYDSTRVKLAENDGYINACYITEGRSRYIATQGPLRTTVIDFWQMVVEQNCSVIVMLTKCEEAGRRKCEKYWPDYKQTIRHGAINIKNQEETYFGGYVKRMLKVYSPTFKEYEVIQYQFLNWPDHGVPATTSGFFRLHKSVMESYNKARSNAPLLVHCSAGVGRTGAFIGYDILCNENENKSSVDIYNCIISMRKQRVDMVQTCDQYKLLHKLVLERYLFGETDVTKENIRSVNNDILEREFQNLVLAESINRNSSEEDHTKKQVHKNRVVIVRQPEDTEWISIDATYVEAYDWKTHLIAAQSPLNSTVEYFLRAFLDNNIDITVTLDGSCPESSVQDNLVQYWPPSTNEPLTVNNITVTLEHQSTSYGFIERKLILSRNQEQKVVTQYHFTNWGSNELPSDTTGILQLIHALRNFSKKRSGTTVLVHCRDGTGRSGILCALINILERIEQEKKLDVFCTVKDLRSFRPGMIQTPSQYKFCYEVGQGQLCAEAVYENKPLASHDEEPLYMNIRK